MKTMISLLILAATLKASASFYVEYNSEARWLLTDVVSLCPNEMTEEKHMESYHPLLSLIRQAQMGSISKL